MHKIIKSAHFWIVLSLSLLNLFLIYHHLDQKPFWLDEAGVAIALERNFTQLLPYAIYDGHPLAYIYSLKIWSVIFGKTEFALRSFSALFAILFIPGMYLTAKNLFSSKVAIWSALIASTNYFLIWYGTQNKAYSFIAFYSLILTFFFMRLIKDLNTKNSLIYALISGLGIYFHPWYIFVLSVHFVILALLVLKKRRLTIALFSLITAIISIPGLLIILHQANIGISSRLDTVQFWIFWIALGNLGYGLIWVYLILIGITILIYFIKTNHNSTLIFPFKNQLIIVATLTFAPLLIGITVSGFKPAFEVGRYEIIVLPTFIILIALILSTVRYKFFYILSFLLFFTFTYNEVLKDEKQSQNYKSTDKSVSKFLLRNIDNNDYIITTDLSYATFYYYLKQQNLSLNKKYNLVSFPKEISSHPGWKNMKLMSMNKQKYRSEAKYLVNQALIENKNIWVLNNKQNELNTLLLNEIEESYKNKKIKKLPLPYMNTWFHEIIIYSN